jgi:hypothetical protein
MIEPFLSSSSVIYIEIIPSKIIGNLILFGTSEITHDYKEDLILDPGTFSTDPDELTFNPYVTFIKSIKTLSNLFLF